MVNQKTELTYKIKHYWDVKTEFSPFGIFARMRHFCFYAFLALFLMVTTADAMCKPIPCPPECPKCDEGESERHLGCNCCPTCIKYLKKGDTCQGAKFIPFNFEGSKLSVCGKGLNCVDQKCQ
ncbi:uncharacterized protein TNIN_436281 [Trichonephila inaurata madagascariensis]|uniref:Uncharacterized protein n=1 Tax=Trichonephila inaurata madagascariensis TaxID=2747483 RepID=A0A8X7CCT6_9ARAC|nr:uncharacterized protein TNIN_436281 [Trichonephila inaurata madagascariensis]